MMKKSTLKLITITLPLAICLVCNFTANANEYPPVKAITSGPNFHWFGYYDKLQFDPSNRYVLCMEVDFEHRSPTKNDVIIMGMIDLEDNNKWTTLGESRSWGWQQGCMLQWIPGSKTKVIWNDRRGDQFVSIIKDIKTGEERTLSKAIYALTPDGKYAIGTEFSRIQNYRKGYGYPGVVDPYVDENAPEKSGLYRIDLATGKSKLLFSYHHISKILNDNKDISDQWHYFNHLLVSPDSKRFIFLNRWYPRKKSDEVPKDPNKKKMKYTTRMFTASIDGDDIYLLDPSGKTSHFIWKDNNHITAWTQPIGKHKGFWEFTDKTSDVRQVGDGIMTENGHNTFVPHTDSQWILNDTYPRGEKREQKPYLFHEQSGEKILLGRFHSPKVYTKEWRCGTHPRSSNDGKTVCIDSPHGGNGRQMYLIDISKIIKTNDKD